MKKCILLHNVASSIFLYIGCDVTYKCKRKAYNVTLQHYEVRIFYPFSLSEADEASW